MRVDIELSALAALAAAVFAVLAVEVSPARQENEYYLPLERTLRIAVLICTFVSSLFLAFSSNRGPPRPLRGVLSSDSEPDSERFNSWLWIAEYPRPPSL
jgi:hypothetical protein